MHEVAGFTDPEDTDRLHKPPSESMEIERGIAALVPFVQRWSLPLNPEDLGEMVVAVLKAAANAPDADVPLPCHDGTGPAHREHANHGPK